MLTRLAFLRRAPLAALALLAPRPAAAHLMLHASDPADGATLDASPRAVTLTFTDDCRITALRLLDEAGREQPIRRDGGRAASRRASAAVAAPLAPGGYRLEWRGMGDDGHVMSGTVRFAVAAAR